MNDVSDALSLVTVVLVTYQRLPMLQEAVGSVLAQTFRDWNLVIVDDASRDGTAGWLRTLRDDRITSICLRTRQERASTRNHGLESVTGRYVLFLDDDDRLRPRALEHLTGLMEADREAVLAAGARIVFDAEGSRRRSPHPRVRLRRAIPTEVIVPVGWALPVFGQVLCRTETVRAAGGWNPGWVPVEDHDLWLRMAPLGPAILSPAVVLEHRVHSGQRKDPDGFGSLALAVRRWHVETRPDTSTDRRLLEGEHWLRAAAAAMNAGRPRTALRYRWRACREAPEILASPVTGPKVVVGLAKASFASIVGPRGVRQLRRLRAALVHAWRPSPDRV